VLLFLVLSKITGHISSDFSTVLAQSGSRAVTVSYHSIYSACPTSVGFSFGNTLSGWELGQLAKLGIAISHPIGHRKITVYKITYEQNTVLN